MMRMRSLRAGPILLASVLAASHALAAELVRGPYLQVGRPSGVTVRWRTDVATDSRVQWGTSWTTLDQSLEANGPKTEHELTLDGLVAGTTYYYSVGSTTETLAGGDADHRFRTSPLPGSTGPTRVWIIGDSGQPGPNAQAVRDAYLAYPGADDTDVWLMLGDNAYNNGTDAEYQAGLFDMFPTILRHTVLWPTRGNHDVLFGGQNNDYYDFFTLPQGGEAGGLPSGSEAYWSFDYANIHFVCLDSEGSDRSVAGDMLTWLELDLAANAKTWIIAFFHHPVYSKGSHDSDNPADSGGRMRDMRENALPILEEGGVDLVLGGHSHSYERSMLIDGHYGLSTTFAPSMIVDGGDGDVLGDGAYTKPGATPAPHEGAVYAVAGSGSKTGGGPLNHPVMVTSLNVYGSMVLDVSATTLDAIFLRSTGGVLDRFRIEKDTGVVGASGPGVPGVPAPRLTLEGASPNPFDRNTTVSFTLAAPGRVKLQVLDVGGRSVASLVDGPREGGKHRVIWMGHDDEGRSVAPGVYFLRLAAEGETRVKRVIRRDRAQD